jgi:hypothetical protein
MMTECLLAAPIRTSRFDGTTRQVPIKKKKIAVGLVPQGKTGSKGNTNPTNTTTPPRTTTKNDSTKTLFKRTATANDTTRKSMTTAAKALKKKKKMRKRLPTQQVMADGLLADVVGDTINKGTITPTVHTARTKPLGPSKKQNRQKKRKSTKQTMMTIQQWRAQQPLWHLDTVYEEYPMEMYYTCDDEQEIPTSTKRHSATVEARIVNGIDYDDENWRDYEEAWDDGGYNDDDGN